MTAPVVPACVGTHQFSRTIGARYTIGRDYVGAALMDVFQTTDDISADIETFGTGVDARRLKSVTVGHATHAVILDPRDPMQAELVKIAFERARTITFHNSVYDVVNLYLNRLITLRQVDKVLDTIIWARMAMPSDIGGHDLFKAGKTYCGLDDENYLLKSFKALGLSKEDGYRIYDLDRLVYVQGAAADVIITARLAPVVRQAAYNMTTSNHPFTDHGVTGDEAWRLVDREQRINRIFLKQACRGLPIDLDYMDVYRAKTHETRVRAENEMHELGIEPGNGDSLIAWLEANNELPEWHKKTQGGKWSAEAKALEMLSHPIAKMFVAQKKIVKVEKDYLQKAIDMAICGPDGVYRVNPVTNVLKAATGRASMADPPFHQFNGPARGIIMAEPGRSLTSADWSAIEPTVVANLAGEVGAYTHYETWYPDRKHRDTGELGTWGDFYEGIAELAGITRKKAKVVLLAALYGEGKKKLAADLGVTLDEAQGLQNQIFDGIPNIANFIQNMKSTGRQHRKIMTISGRIIPVPMGVYDGQWSVQSHKAVNYVVQGSAYDVLAETLIAAEEAGISDGVLWGMHDEIIMDSEIENDLRKLMETPPERLCKLSGRTPMLRTDMTTMGERWLEEV
jgi:DNA polymerase-1